MKDSGIKWVGKIPEDWNVRRIKHCANLNQEKLSTTTDPNYTFRYIDIGSVTEYGGISNTVEMTFEKSPSRARMVVHHGDTIISTVRTYLKAVAFIDHLKDHICSTGFCVLSPRANLHPKFGYYLLQSDYVVQKIVSESVGVSYPAISSANIGNIKIALPRIGEQAKLATYLDAKCSEIDMLIAAKEKTNTLLKELRQSIIYEAVTKGLDPTFPMRNSGVEWIGEIPEGWSTLRMKHLAVEPLLYGANATGVDFDSKLPRYVRITDITTERNLASEGKQSLPENIAYNYMLEPGDILFARSGATSGKSFYYEECYGRCCFAGYLIRFRPDSRKAISKFLYYYTLTEAYEQWTQQIFIQATIQNISAEKYNNLIFAIPSTLEEQKKIVLYLDTECEKLDKIILANDSIIRKLKEYRQSLIFEAVTGKFEIEKGEK
jgi:restriction endonuclease S subunit